MGERVLTFIADLNSKLNDFVWGPFMLVLLVGTGVMFTVRTGFFQFRRVKLVWHHVVNKLFKKKSGDIADGELTPFQALATALAGTIGTGNIVGVATALVWGGPGAVFWMWVSAIFGMMTKYAEVVLAITYRKKNENGEWSGGPMYYIEYGMGKKFKWLAFLFALFAFIASFGIGNMTQVNALAEQLNVTFSINPLFTGIAVAFAAGLVILGGVKRIGVFTEKLVPFMSLLYIVFSVATIIINHEALPEAFASIFRSAFNIRSAAGGVTGYFIMHAMRYGFARGVFSNEAGLGSAPIAHAASSTNGPIEQGMLGIFEVFVDTIVICTLTALVILSSGSIETGLEGAALTAHAFSTAIGTKAANIFMAIAIFCFSFSTIISWSYYGSKCLEYLGGKKMCNVYKVFYTFCLIIGAVIKLALAWKIADTLNGLMAIPNLISLICLSGIVVKQTKDYERNLKLKG